MTHNETRVSNERLTDLLTAETMLVVTVEEFRSILTEIQALRSTPVAADHIADAGKMVEVHPLPNPSPSDGEVSEVLAAQRIFEIFCGAHVDWAAHSANDGEDNIFRSADWAQAMLYARAALKFKRRQP